MALLADTSVLIAGERGRLAGERLFDRGEALSVSAISLGEFWKGVERAEGAERRRRREAFFDRVVESFTVVPLELGDAVCSARLWADLARRGTMIGALDLLIGATAVERGWRLLTLDVRDFGRIPELEVIDLSPELDW